MVPILDYSAAVWGYRQYQQIDNVQNRAMRYFLGVHRFTPGLALTGDTGWLPSTYRRWAGMLRLWNRLIKMDESRVTKMTFHQDYARCNNNWSYEIKQIMQKLGLTQHFEHKTVVDLTRASSALTQHYANIWSTSIQTVPKLRTLRII